VEPSWKRQDGAYLNAYAVQGPGLSRQGFCPDNFTREKRARICLDFFASDFVWTADFRPLTPSFHSLFFFLDKA
jgi:hypothetical protein